MPSARPAPTSWQDHYHQILDAAPDAMLVLGCDERIVFVNRQTESLFGYTRERLLGQPLDMLIPERFRSGHQQHLRRFMACPTMRPMGSGRELYGLRADGSEVAIEVSLSPVSGAQGSMVAAALRDITDRKREAEALRQARGSAEAASAAKSDFLSSMSHELRTPLNAILGFAQLLQRSKRDPLADHHRARVDQILRGGEHLLRLIDDILDLSRIEAGGISMSIEAVGLRDVLDEVLITLQPMAERSGIRINAARLPERLPVISADRTRFAQILMNFGSNAIKYNRTGGEVCFEVTQHTGGPIRVTVSDTGYGISADNQDKLFQPFQRAGQEAGPIQGTGIGLVITRRLAELMQGQVGFTSSLGEGSAFWVEIPVHASAAAPAAVAPGAARVPAAGPTAHPHHVVLYVEDNPANVSFMQDLLGNFDGVEMIVARSGEVGLQLARERRPTLIIMDINLPGISGVDAMLQLRGFPETENIPVVALTAAASASEKARGVRAGFYRYLTKPVRVDEFEAAIEPLLSGPTTAVC